MPMTEAYGFVADRQPREPAPLLCEGRCSSESGCGPVMKMHTFARRCAFKVTVKGNGVFRATVIHDCYKCNQCQHERIWG